MNLATNFKLSAIDYAAQGNSIIGIRNSGKTYSATKVAEELMNESIPIVAFDPTGVWQNLRNGVNGHKGFPVVVAGGLKGDIPLTEFNATKIIEAALKEHVSIIIDLKGTSTSNKSKWIRIVSDCVEFLMGNNDQYGLRHVFIEEAAEFVPQKPSPGGALVYSRIESLARMGRNFGLGYTLINQRAEEIAKAVFEISEMVLVHRQAGKNSLNSIKNWLELRNDEKEIEIIKSLPKLGNGECWAINEVQSVLIKVNSKQTFHPDPKSGKSHLPANALKADTSSFIEKMNKQLQKEENPKSEIKYPKSEIKVQESEINSLKIEINIAKQNLSEQNKLLSEKDKLIKHYSGQVEEILKILGKDPPKIDITTTYKEPAQYVKNNLTLNVVHKNAGKVAKNYASNGTVTGGAMRMLKASAMYSGGITKTRMATLARLSHTSGSFGTYLSTLRREELITGDKNNFCITQKGLQVAGDVDPLPTDPRELIELWADVIGNQSGAARMLRELGNRYPKSYSKIQLGDVVGMIHTSGSFGTYLSTLKRNGLIKIESGEVKAADELFN